MSSVLFANSKYGFIRILVCVDFVFAMKWIKDEPIGTAALWVGAAENLTDG